MGNTQSSKPTTTTQEIKPKQNNITICKLHGDTVTNYSNIATILQELKKEELFYVIVKSQNIKLRALDKTDTCKIKLVSNSTSEYYIPLIWDIVSNVLKAPIKSRLNVLRQNLVSHIIEVIKKDGRLSTESVGTHYTEAKSSSDIDINVFYENKNTESESIERDIYNTLGVNTLQDIHILKYNLDIMFDINLYPYSESIDCTKYDPNNDVLPHKRITKLVRQFNLTPFFNNRDISEITEYNNNDEISNNSLLSVSDLTTSMYADSLKDIYYSQAARCHIVKDESPEDASEEYRIMYLYSFIDNFGFLLKTLYETNECTATQTYKRLSRVCKYLERMCDALLKRGKSNKMIKNSNKMITKLKKKSASINQVRKKDYIYNGSVRDFYGDILQVLDLLFVNRTSELVTLDPYSAETWLLGVLLFFNDQLKEYNDTLLETKVENALSGGTSLGRT